MTQISLKWKVAVLAGLTMLIWSALFSTTFSLPFYYDDLHFIRSYSWAELLSTFHGPNDPDGIETMALRPMATLLYCFQGITFGENVVIQRVFMAVLMGGFLWTIGLLLNEVGLSLRHIAVVFVLFASSRVFSSLMLWITLGALILSYIFMTLTTLFYLRWLKGEQFGFLVLTLCFATLSIFTREEAYTLPVVLPILWYISSPCRTNRKRPMAGAFGVALIMAAHFVLRQLFVSEVPSIQLSIKSVSKMLVSVLSAWIPFGCSFAGRADGLIILLWIVFLGILLLSFVCISSGRLRTQFFGICVLGFIFCSPSLGVWRSFGIAMPTLAFFTAISVAIFEINTRISSLSHVRCWWQPLVMCMLLLGLALGVGGGLRRSIYVAESMHEKAAGRVVNDGQFLFDLFPKPTSIPYARREEGLARLAALGIRSREDLELLKRVIKENPYQLKLNRISRSELFLETYPYACF